MRRLLRGGLVLFVLVALLAPLLSNDVPLVARVGGTLRFPALRSYAGVFENGPDPASSTTWQEWWVELGDDSSDWAVMPPWPYGPLMKRDLAIRNQRPDLAHPFGTDDLGRDLLMRVIWGSHTALTIGFGAVLLALAVGVPLGAVAGYLGGFADRLVSIVIEVSLCFPALFLVMIVATFAADSALAVVVVLGAVYWTGFARIVRGELLSLREREFVLAARGLGLGTARVLRRHLLPQLTVPVLANVGFVFASAIVTEAALAFFGIGPGASTGGESWGRILAVSKEPALRGAWHLWLFPSLALVGTVACVHAWIQRITRQGARSR